jgi:hypothetical protein
MRKLAGFLGLTIGGAIGWWLGAYVGLFSAFVVSTVGSGVGLYYARRAADEYLP